VLKIATGRSTDGSFDEQRETTAEGQSGAGSFEEADTL
jgi:hypothetical protein